jgi:sugar (pentulose or hexulose) kinase
MYLGLDFGTSGARACVIDDSGSVTFENRYAYSNSEQQTPSDWREALHFLLKSLPGDIASGISRIAVDATSSSVLLCGTDLEPVSPALLYNDTRALVQASHLTQLAPDGHVVLSANSGLSKFLWLTRHIMLEKAAHFMHQADWLSALLTNRGGVSDYHNALKSGYDVEQHCWPDWILQLPHSHLLPHVLSPGEAIDEISETNAIHFGINTTCTVHAGTTDSIAAFIAADVHHPGTAVTSLGTTMVLKLLSETRVEASKFGIYSHRYGNLWLTGGASNAGGGVLRQHFTNTRLLELSKQIDCSTDSELDYYPLPRKGERFPYYDPDLLPRLSPRPDNDAQFLHGILQGLSRIEHDGYALLAQHNATPLRAVFSVGGGAKNSCWTQIRQRLLGVPVNMAQHTEAAYGSALLARNTAVV